MREQFENFPRIKPILRLVKYSESSDGYDPLDQKSIYEKYADWLNGAWYVFQEQQKSHQQETERLKNQLLAAEAEIARLQSRVDGAMDFYNTAKSDANIGMIRMAQYLKGEVK